MLSLFQRQPLIGVLAIACAALAGIVGLESGFGVRLGPSIPSGAVRPAPAFQAKLLPALAPVNADQEYPEMVARPLFVPLRRPAPPAEATPQSSMKRGQFVLQGVTIAGDTRIALLKEKATGHIYRVEKGRDVNGLKLAEVSPEAVTLTQGKEQEVLPLQVIKPGPAALTPNAGPFGATAPGAPGTPGNPLAHPGAANPNVPPSPLPGFGPAPNPSPGVMPQASTAPLSPEELLARRRARRAQSTQ